ncbi:MAG: hypothetical protein ACJ788_07035 [Ktedonobacteraceae bacterium]
MYFASREGGIKKYGWWRSNSTPWEQLDDLPPVHLVGEVECELAAGVETLWMINSEGNVEQWWRSSANGTDWTRGVFYAAFSTWVPSSITLKANTIIRSPRQ